jgi:hypothetical protein
MPAPHAFYSKMLAERTASRNVFVLFYFIYFTIVRCILLCSTVSSVPHGGRAPRARAAILWDGGGAEDLVSLL